MDYDTAYTQRACKHAASYCYTIVVYALYVEVSWPVLYLFKRFMQTEVIH